MATLTPLGAGSWRNSDGLIIYFGPKEGTSGLGGEYKAYGPDRTQEVLIDMATLTTSAQYLDQHFELPKGAFIESVELETLVAATSSGTGTFSLGLKQSDQSTNISDTALINAATVASFTAAGTKIIYTVGVTGVGANVGTALSVNGLFTAKVSAVYQTGRVAIRVNYNFLPLT